MKVDCGNNEELLRIVNNTIQRQKQEHLASATLTTEVLNRLSVSVDTLPQKCQQLLLEVSERQVAAGLEQVDPVAISQLQTCNITQQLSDEYQVLELRQENQELEKQITENRKFIEGLRKELERSKESLANQNPNPDNIQEHVRQMKQKLSSYEEIYEKAKVKFTKLQVPEAILPKPLEELAARLAVLREEEVSHRQRADDVTLARRARDTLTQLRR